MFDEMPSRLPFKRATSVNDHIPPKFPTKQITTPIAIFYGKSDSLVSIDELIADLPQPLAYIKSIDRWEHLDFIWAKGVDYIVYPDILGLLNHFNPTSLSDDHHPNSHQSQQQQQQQESVLN